MILSKDALYILQKQKLEEDENGDLTITRDIISGGDMKSGDNLYLGLDTSAASGTTDGDLYAAIVALGWQSEVIE